MELVAVQPREAMTGESWRIVSDVVPKVPRPHAALAGKGLSDHGIAHRCYCSQW